MKKITLGLHFLLIEEIQETLNQNDAQVLIAFGDNFEAKKGLIQSSELNSDGLIALCTNPEPMKLNDNKVQNWFKDAIERTELTAEQEVQIARFGEFAYDRALLLSTNLTADGLVAVCENPGDLNLNDNKVQNWFKDAIERTELTAEQEVQIARIGEFAYNRALLLSTNLTADGLVAVCENPDDFNLNNNTVQNWFKDAIERTELTAEQKALIAKSKVGGLGLF